MAKVNIIRWDQTNLVPQLLGSGDTAMINNIDVTGSAGDLKIGGVDADNVYLGKTGANVYVSSSWEALADASASAGLWVTGSFDTVGGQSFAIDGTYLTTENFTAANIDILLNGSNADSLHTHGAAAPTISGTLIIEPDIVHLYTNNEVLSGTEVVYLSGGDNVVALADADVVNSSRVIGVASGSTAVIYASGSSVPVRTIYGDRIDGFTGLTPGAVYYLSDTPGQITTTPGFPGSGKMIVQVGIATSASEMILQPDIRVRGLA